RSVIAPHGIHSQRQQFFLHGGTRVAFVSQTMARVKGEPMACPHFIEGQFSRCAAVRGLLIPSIYERERFCRSEQGCKHCPTFRAFEARGGMIGQEIYYKLWLPEVGLPADKPAADSIPLPV